MLFPISCFPLHNEICRIQTLAVCNWYHGLWPVYGTTCTPPANVPITDCHYSKEDSLIFVQKIKNAHGDNLRERTLWFAKSFLGIPYKHHTLEVTSTEQTVINLRALDCWTYMDVALALAQTAGDSLPAFEHYVSRIRQLRYPNGVVNGYGSRLHYFYEWILNASELGLVRDITQELGGVPNPKTIQYITAHPIQYPKMKDSLDIARIKAGQERINAHEWHYIPKAQVKKIASKIETGDIIVLVSSRKDLDVEHQGFAVRDKDGVLKLLHASSTGGKVLISGRPLDVYLSRLPAMSGIMVIRIQ